MVASNDEIERRRKAAVVAIRKTHETAANADDVSLFVSHHLVELADDYWIKHCGVACPAPLQVLDLFVLQSHWGDEDDRGIDNFEFTLPDDVTNYLISVGFDENGDVTGISMES